MPLVTSSELLKVAKRERFAIGAFNANNMEMVQAVIEAAEEENAPVILQVSQGAIAYAGLSMATALVKTAAERAKVPVVLHLDHGTSYEQNLLCLGAGFTSLMYDGSAEPLEKNIEITKKIVKEAHKFNIPVEAELGKIPRIEDYFEKGLLPKNYDYSYPIPSAVKEDVKNLMANPDDAERFVKETGCDSLAVAIGSIHGMEKDIKPLNIERLKEIRKRTDLPLVLHGSSGVIPTWERVKELEKEIGLKLDKDEGPLVEAIKEGICKINVATEISMSFLEGIREAIEKEKEKKKQEKDMRKIISVGRERAKARIKEYIRLFGASGKASLFIYGSTAPAKKAETEQVVHPE
ncbi:MAG: class II fructose-bisphosphate aldolase [Nitrososphaerota archaeon]